jgi:oxygen-independent coproporphyrinogen-3 oxidase
MLLKRQTDSVYFGGGTPSLWAPHYVESIVSQLRTQFDLARDAEITLEANPGAADTNNFRGFARAGINRLSIGIQSFDLTTLTFLGRGHSGDEAERAVRAAHDAGFENVSLDFIYGVPGQTVGQVRNDAKRAVGLSPTHLSAYALTLGKDVLAEEVPLARQLERGEIALPDDDVVLAMADVIRSEYERAGYQRYEISNFARAGYHSRHNALYWTGGEYLALGAGATGCIRRDATHAQRYTNHRSAERYLQDVEHGKLPESAPELLGPKELFEERVAMGLRLTSGVDIESLCHTFGEPFVRRQAEVGRLLVNGFAFMQDRRVTLTHKGADLHSSISARLI